MNDSFDYEVLHTCQHELLDSYNNPHDCGEPATHKVWWLEDMSDAMLVCPEHFASIKKAEEKEADKSCKSCYWNWIIQDTLSASEGTVDLSDSFCQHCYDFSSWEELKSKPANGEEK